MIEFYCAKCNRKVAVKEEFAGRKGKCKDCGHINRIPAAADMLPSTLAVGSAEAGPSSPPVDESLADLAEGEPGAVASDGELSQWLQGDPAPHTEPVVDHHQEEDPSLSPVFDDPANMDLDGKKSPPKRRKKPSRPASAHELGDPKVGTIWGIVMILLGALMDIYAFSMEIGVEGTANLSLMNERLCIVVSGGFTFLAGVVVIYLQRLHKTVWAAASLYTKRRND